MKRKTKRDPILLEVIADMGKGGITIGPIHALKTLVHGYVEGGRIRINPAVEVVDTALHEVIHRVRPQWSERTVKARTTKLMSQLSVEEIDMLYNLVVSNARKAKSAVKIR